MDDTALKTWILKSIRPYSTSYTYLLLERRVTEGLPCTVGFPGGSVAKNPHAMQETWVWSLGWDDPLEKGMATHFSILAWRIPWTLWCMELQRVGHDWATFTYFTYHVQYCARPWAYISEEGSCGSSGEEKWGVVGGWGKQKWTAVREINIVLKCCEWK